MVNNSDLENAKKGEERTPKPIKWIFFCLPDIIMAYAFSVLLNWPETIKNYLMTLATQFYPQDPVSKEPIYGAEKISIIATIAISLITVVISSVGIFTNQGIMERAGAKLKCLKRSAIFAFLGAIILTLFMVMYTPKLDYYATILLVLTLYCIVSLLRFSISLYRVIFSKSMLNHDVKSQNDLKE